MTNTEKPAPYGKRYLGVRGTKARVQLFLSAGPRAQLGPLARRKNCTLTALIEDLAAPRAGAPQPVGR